MSVSGGNTGDGLSLMIKVTADAIAGAAIKLKLTPSTKANKTLKIFFFIL
jgi:hypothetical protein